MTAAWPREGRSRSASRPPAAVTPRPASRSPAPDRQLPEVRLDRQGGSTARAARAMKRLRAHYPGAAPRSDGGPLPDERVPGGADQPVADAVEAQASHL